MSATVGNPRVTVLLQQSQIATPKLVNLKYGSSSMSNGNKMRNILSQPFKVSHQRVNIDVDMLRNRIDGFTELTLVPFTNTLKVVRLDCREMKITRVTINNMKPCNYIHNDILYINDGKYFDEEIVLAYDVNLFDLYSDEVSIHQHHMIKHKLGYIFGESNYDPRDPHADVFSTIVNTEELSVMLPDNLRLELTDINSIHTPGSQPGTLTPLHLKLKATNSDIYTPIQLRIEYELVNPKNGVNFVSDSIEKRNWHSYTTNNTYNLSTSSWVPCIDNLWDRSTWSLEVIIPRTVRDIGNPRIIGSEEAMRGSRNQKKKRRLNRNDDSDIEDDEDNEDDDNENHDLVVCSGDFNNVKETPHSIDLSKKVVSWSIFNPVCAHHVGWALGCFENFVISESTESREVDDEIKENFEDIDKDGTSSPITIYCLPGQIEQARNTCIFTMRAMDFFLKEFGSFPFSSYGIVFVQDSVVDTNNFAGLSIFSDSILYPSDIIEPMFTSTEVILEAISSQWSGISITPQTVNDIWCTIGIAKFMVFQYLKDLMGTNEYRFKIKKMMNRIVEEDRGKKPLGYHYFRFPVSDSDLDFIKLKAPIVLFILDKRMTKTDKSFGLSRVLPKLFLQAMSGDLQNGTLSTQHFQYVCEKVNRNKLENFFKQWVYGVGAPIFNITQRFNKKRGVIEMSIRQIQHQVTRKSGTNAESFINDSIAYLEDEPTFPVQSIFTGPMTIRVHEADGTPYEHIVDLKEGNTKLDVQYNSKFRRMKKNRDETSENAVTFSRLGDVLESEKEMEEWNLADWAKVDDDPMNIEAFEWIRVDVDFEWIARFDVKQPDYMFGSQLQHDRDVEAQFDAVRYLGNIEKPSTIHCTALTRTVVDERYYYGVRIAAAEALANFSNSVTNFIGVPYLVKIYRELYCFPGSSIPLSNDFNDFGRFFLQKEIPKQLCKIRDSDDEVPVVIRNLILNLIKFNDNTNNNFQDSFYISELVQSLTTCAVNSSFPNSPKDIFPKSHPHGSLEKKKFVANVITEINRLQKLDEWIPSYHNVVSVTCLTQKIRLALHGHLDLSFEDLLYFTVEKFPIQIRVEAFRGLFVLGGLKNRHILNYFLKACLLDVRSAAYRELLISALIDSICVAAVSGTPSTLDDPEFKPFEKLSESKTGASTALANMIIVEDGSHNEMDEKRDVFARATVSGAIDILRRDYSIGKGLKRTIWELLHTSLLSIREKRNLFLICQILYKEIDLFVVKIPIPNVPLNELTKKIVTKNLGNGKVVFKRQGRFKIQLASQKLLIEKPKAKEPKVSHKKPVDRTVNEVALNPDESKEPKLKLNLSIKPSAPPAAPPPTESPTKKQKKQAPAPKKHIPVVSIGTHNSRKFELSFKFQDHSLPELKPVSGISVKVGRSQVSVDGGKVKFNFKGAFKSRFRDLMAKPVEPAPPQKPKPTLPAVTTVEPNARYVKILTKEKKVLISSTPFEVSKELSPIKQEVAESLRIPDSTTSLDASKQSEKKSVSTPDSVASRTDKQTRSSLVEPEVQAKDKTPVTPFSKAASPFSSSHSPHGTKRKKTKIYIHSGDNSKSLSPPDAQVNNEVKNEQNVDNVQASLNVEETQPIKKELAKTKLKLKLNLKK